MKLRKKEDRKIPVKAVTMVPFSENFNLNSVYEIFLLKYRDQT